MHGIQAWVALPEGQEEIDPAFAHHSRSDLPEQEEDGVWRRLIAGESFGAKANVKTHSPTFYLHCEMRPGAKVVLPSNYLERAAYVATGEVEADGGAYHAGQMLVFTKGAVAELGATRRATVMLLGGEPLGPRFIEWNFVSSSKERIEQAKADWRAGRMKLPDLDNKEFTPLPEPSPPAQPMS